MQLLGYQPTVLKPAKSKGLILLAIIWFVLSIPAFRYILIELSNYRKGSVAAIFLSYQIPYALIVLETIFVTVATGLLLITLGVMSLRANRWSTHFVTAISCLVIFSAVVQLVFELTFEYTKHEHTFQDPEWQLGVILYLVFGIVVPLIMILLYNFSSIRNTIYASGKPRTSVRQFCFVALMLWFGLRGVSLHAFAMPADVFYGILLKGTSFYVFQCMILVTIVCTSILILRNSRLGLWLSYLFLIILMGSEYYIASQNVIENHPQLKFENSFEDALRLRFWISHLPNGDPWLTALVRGTPLILVLVMLSVYATCFLYVDDLKPDPVEPIKDGHSSSEE